MQMRELSPLPLKGVRIADLTWALASAGNSTLLASLGAEVIRIEWPARMDFTRLSETAGVGISSREIQRTPLGPGKNEIPYQKKGPPRRHWRTAAAYSTTATPASTASR